MISNNTKIIYDYLGDVSPEDLEVLGKAIHDLYDFGVFSDEEHRMLSGRIIDLSNQNW